MSRCFPFPPPGYEKKATTNNSDLLKKEKHREKKHKKEKKDKEKKESREKQEKDRSDGKHREKKEKREKHRDKKEKEKDKDNDRNNNSDEKRAPGKSEGHDGEKALDEKKLPGKSVGHTPENIIKKENARDKDWSSISGEKKPAGQFYGCNGERLSQNNHLAEETKNYRFVQELGRRVRDEDRGTGSQLVENFTIAKRKMDEGMVRMVATGTGPSMGGKEKNNDKTGDDRKLDGQGTKDEARFSGNAMVQNLVGISKTRVEGIPRKLENDVERVVEGKEKTKEKEGDESRFSGNALVQTLSRISQPKVEGIPRKLEKDVEKMVEGKEKTKEKEGDDKRGDKRKDKNREKKGQGKDKDRDKEKKKEEKAKEKSEQKKREQDKLKEKKGDLICSHNIKTSHLSMESNKSALTDENIRKRKDIETNGFLHVNDVRPNKLPRSHSSHPLPENGRILEAGQTSSLSTLDRLGTANNLKVENKERKVNGMVDAQPFPVFSTKPSVASAQAGQIAEVSMKPPHLDSKHLSEVLSVPKMEEWSDFDDQDWLFHNSESQSKKPKVGSSKIDETSQVWSESLRIESADIIALPYVIPY